jgi:hypothetical protein
MQPVRTPGRRLGGVATAAAAAVALAAGLAGCGSSHRSAASTTTTPATVPLTTPSTTVPGGSSNGTRKATTTTTTRASTSAAITTAVTYVAPVGVDGGQGPGLAIASSVDGTCQSGSEVIVGVSVYRCTSGTTVYDPCWAVTAPHTNAASYALCQEQPWSNRVVELHAAGLTAGVTVGATDLSDPWGVALNNGQDCLAIQGDHATYDGQPVDMACSAGGLTAALELLGSPDRTTAGWTYQSVSASGSSYMIRGLVVVKTAWFAGPKPASAEPACAASQLVPAIGRYDSSSGHEGVVVLFRNPASTACVVSGYPDVNGLSSVGEIVAVGVHTPGGPLGGLVAGQIFPPDVVIGAGQAASALVEGDTGTSCPASFNLDVFPPGGVTTTELHLSLLAKGLETCGGLLVHPLVAGSSGTE